MRARIHIACVNSLSLSLSRTHKHTSSPLPHIHTQYAAAWTAWKMYYRPLDFGGAAVVIGIPSLICHGQAVYDAFECWRRASNEDVEWGQTFFVVQTSYWTNFYMSTFTLIIKICGSVEHLCGLLYHINYQYHEFFLPNPALGRLFSSCHLPSSNIAKSKN